MIPLAVLATLASCGHPPETSSPASTPGRSIHSLVEFCRDHACTFDGYRAEITGRRPCARGEAGTCGATLRYVELDGVDGNELAYFDASGNPVAAETSSDMGYSAAYGLLPSCTKQVTEHLCGLQPGQHSE
jgi:hypothetical protein